MNLTCDSGHQIDIFERINLITCKLSSLKSSVLQFWGRREFWGIDIRYWMQCCSSILTTVEREFGSWQVETEGNGSCLNIHIEETHGKVSDPTSQDHWDLDAPPILEAQTYILDPNDIPESDLYFTEVEDVEFMDDSKFEETSFQRGLVPKSEADLKNYIKFEEAFSQESGLSKRGATFEREESPEIIIEAVYSVKDEPADGNLLHCPHCHYNTYDSTDLATHIRAKKDWTFQCQDCEFSSCTSQGIIDHRDETHYGDEAELENTKEEPEVPLNVNMEQEELFKCNNCSYTATTEWTLIRHQRQVKGEPFKCSLCEYTSCSEYVLKRHEKLCNGVTPTLPLQQPKIEQDLDSGEDVPGTKLTILKPGNKWKQRRTQRRQLLKLQQQRKLQKQQKWLQQKKLQQQKLILQQKLQQKNQYFENQNRRHVCPYCRKVFKKNHLADHIKIHTGEKPYKCDKCSFAGAQPSSLKQHKSRKENHDPPLQCTECSFTSCNSVFLRKHVTECHSNTLNIPEISPSVQNIHELVVAEVHPTKRIIPSAIRHFCSYCSYSSLNKSKLTRHVSIHFDNKPYQCQYCTYRCRNSTDIKTHERTHTGERPYKCSICPAAFAQAGAFAKHRRTHVEYGYGVKDSETKHQPPVLESKEESITGEHFLAATSFEEVGSTAPDVETYFKCEYCEYQSKSRPDVIATWVADAIQGIHLIGQSNWQAGSNPNPINIDRRKNRAGTGPGRTDKNN
ncbi:unnamed protein product [Allacma fusca]|uniref:C2H2-type domain-containing protein n=1 Tax=Allacma fusca TaxID=39272 RepID=A0A8J2KXC4_9HEXA|nr:unnamed protein product [Allacma fusca]